MRAHKWENMNRPNSYWSFMSQRMEKTFILLTNGEKRPTNAYINHEYEYFGPIAYKLFQHIRADVKPVGRYRQLTRHELSLIIQRIQGTESEIRKSIDPYLAELGCKQKCLPWGGLMIKSKKS